jgi:hypothetical protein
MVMVTVPAAADISGINQFSLSIEAKSVTKAIFRGV